jgi:hypothetical protein
MIEHLFEVLHACRFSSCHAAKAGFSYERMQEDKEAAAGGRGSSAGSSGVDVCTPAILKCLGYAKCTKVDV